MVRRRGFPEVGDYVIVTVRNITPHAAWCDLNEYPGKEGMIHVSEVAGKWVRDIRKFVKVGKMYVAKVMKVDPNKNFISLSLKRVDKTEKRRKMQELRLEQRAEKMLEIAAKKLGKSLDQAYEEVGYMLQENYGTLFAAMEELLESKRLDELPKKWNDALYEIVSKSIVEKERRIVGKIKLQTTKPDGIDDIRKFLLSLQKQGFTVKYISAPWYRVELITTDPKSGEEKLRKTFEELAKEFEGDAMLEMIT